MKTSVILKTIAYILAVANTILCLCVALDAVKGIMVLISIILSIGFWLAGLHKGKKEKEKEAAEKAKNAERERLERIRQY